MPPVSGEVGARAPHIWLDCEQTRSTIDLFDRKLVLVSPDSRWRDTVPAQVAFAHVSESATTYKLGPDGAVLVRPDTFVAARWENAPSDRASAISVAVEQLRHPRV